MTEPRALTAHTPQWGSAINHFGVVHRQNPFVFLVIFVVNFSHQPQRDMCLANPGLTLGIGFFSCFRGSMAKIPGQTTEPGKLPEKITYLQAVVAALSWLPWQLLLLPLPMHHFLLSTQEVISRFLPSEQRTV